MFCPFCGKQNKERAVFCEYCGKAMQKSTPLPKANQRPKKTRAGLSYNAKRGIVTGALIVVVVFVILVIYYPSVLPWNW